MVDLYEDGSDEVELSEDFEPSCHDAIVGWARQNYHHSGNQKLRDIINRNVPHYLNAESKTAKGLLIARIIAQIRRESPTGTGLVRQSPKTLRWSYIGLDKAKDKIGHALRKGAQEYGRKHKGFHCPYEPLPHSTSSSSLLDSTTTATRSMSSSDSDHEEEDAGARNRYHMHSSGGYKYPPAPHGTSYPQTVFHPAPTYPYPATSTQQMMYYHPFSEATIHQHAMYPAYSNDAVVASSYHHYYHSQQHAHYPHPAAYEHAYRYYDPQHTSPNGYGYHHGPEETVAYGVPSYPGYSMVTPSKRGPDAKVSPSSKRSSHHIPILPKQEYTFTAEGPDPWARAIQEAIHP